MEFKLNVPVIFCTFNRLDNVMQVFPKIREARPPRLYLVSDCAREHIVGEKEKVDCVRNYIESHIDWDCEVYKNYAETNMGCGKRISSGISWAFESEESAIILEDDCVPDITFFRYCQEMLEYYKDNDEIMMISGNNPMGCIDNENTTYSFSKVPFIWGWATWKRAWELFDIDLKTFPDAKKNPVWRQVFPLKAYWVYMSEFEALYNHTFNIWGYQWMYAVIYNNKLTIVPTKSHVFNIGFQEEATNTKKMPTWMNQNIEPVKFPIEHPEKISWNREFDRKYFNTVNKHGLIVKIKSMLGLNINKSIFAKK